MQSRSVRLLIFDILDNTFAFLFVYIVTYVTSLPLLSCFSVRSLAVTVRRYVVFSPCVVMLRINLTLQLSLVPSRYGSFINWIDKTID